MDKKRPRRSRAKLAPSEFPVEVEQVHVAETAPTAPRVVGWLYLFYLILMVAPLFHLRTIVLIYQQVAMFFEVSPATSWLFVADVVIRLGLSAFGIFVARGLVSGRANVIRSAKRFLLATFVFAVLSNVVPFFVPMPAVARTVFLLTVWGPSVTCFAWVVIWSAYLRWSRRVRETYGEHEVAGSDRVVTSNAGSRLWRGVATVMVFVWTLYTILLLVNVYNENGLFRRLKDSDRRIWELLGDESNEAVEFVLQGESSPAALLASFEDETLFNATGRVLEMDERLTFLGDRCEEREALVIARLILDTQRRAEAEIKPSTVADALVAAVEGQSRRTVKCAELLETLPFEQPPT